MKIVKTDPSGSKGKNQTSVSKFWDVNLIG